MGSLYYGDNLEILRNEIASESVDLIYLDPPFNSNANYNVLFKAPDGHQSHAQMEAFEDTWHWNASAERAFDEVMQSGNTDAADMLRAMRSFLHDNDMMAYLAMMAVRLIELHRVLKSTGSLYLHCDPTASHYLKAILDAIFGVQNFLDEIVWQRTNAHNFKSKLYPHVHDTIFYYAKGPDYKYKQQYGKFSPQQLKRYEEETGTGRLFTGQDLTIIGGDMKPWRGTTPNGNRGWGLSLGEREKLWEAGLILTRKDGSPRLDGRKVYLDEKEGVPVSDLWVDVPRIANTSGERLGYPTQKPVALLERILNASSDEGDIVLDPFCGCGTTVHAAQKLNREWIGIDVTHLAISLIQKRLRDAFPDVKIDVHGTPRDLDGARALAAQDKYQFQWWAVSLVDAVPYGGRKKGADTGIDGVIYFKPDAKVTEKAIVSVKGGEHVGVAMVRELANVVDREKAKIGMLITLAEPTGPMKKEAVAAGFYKTDHGEYPKVQVLTVQQLFDGKRPNMPWIDPTVFKKAKREMKGSQGDLF